MQNSFMVFLQLLIIWIKPCSLTLNDFEIQCCKMREHYMVPTNKSNTIWNC